MKPTLVFVIVVILAFALASCSQPPRLEITVTAPQAVTVSATAVALTYETATLFPSDTAEFDGPQATLAHIRATKTARAFLTGTATPTMMLSFKTPTVSNTPAPSNTPRATVIPMVAPTFEPSPTTFDVVTIVTRTPASAAQCPVIDSGLKPDVEAWLDENTFVTLKDEPVLEFLNQGGSPDAVIIALEQKWAWFRERHLGARQDLTGDGVAELILSDRRIVYVLGCRDGQYQALLSVTDDPSWMWSIRFLLPGDMNLDGVSEIIIDEYGGHSYPAETVAIYEWGGTAFVSLVDDVLLTEDCGLSRASALLADVTVRDVDENGTFELLLAGEPVPGAQYMQGPPWREMTNIYAWNGVQFVCTQVEYAQPEYRIQAAQDGDRALVAGEYDRALDFYQQTIFSDKLEEWTYDRLRWEINCSASMDACGSHSTPTAGADEYYVLAAYARYRIMLLHILRGYLAEAETVYNTLQEKFPPGQLGRAYAEMATAFWEEYQGSQSIGPACGKAVEYATAHPEDVLSHLGNGDFAAMYFGVQSLAYTPEDMCPFR